MLAGLLPGDEAARRLWTKRVACAWPLVALVLALAIREPVGMVLASGVAQAIMLAALGVAVLYFRYGSTDRRLVPSRGWDALLWLSSAGLVIVGLWTLWQKAAQVLAAAA